MHKTALRVLLGILLCPIILWSAIGVVQQRHGSAHIVRGTQRIPVAKGTRIEQGDILETGRTAWVRIRMNDGTLISAAKNSHLKMSDFVYHKPQDSKATFDLLKGLFKIISGGIGKIAKKKFHVVVPGGTIGIRGTEFYVDIRRRYPRIYCTRGAILARNAFGEVAVPSGSQTQIPAGVRPDQPHPFTRNQIRALIRNLTARNTKKTPGTQSLVRKSKGGIISGNSRSTTQRKRTPIHIVPTDRTEDDQTQHQIRDTQRKKIPDTPVHCPTQ